MRQKEAQDTLVSLFYQNSKPILCAMAYKVSMMAKRES